jgi:HECT-domain (ubiquitin-transferase)
VKESVQIKNYDGDAADLGLDFVVTDEALGQRRDHELVHGGASIPVTNENRRLYVHLCARWHLGRVGGAAAAAFARGLSQARARRSLLSLSLRGELTPCGCAGSAQAALERSRLVRSRLVHGMPCRSRVDLPPLR